MIAHSKLLVLLFICCVCSPAQAFLIQTFSGEDAPIQQTWASPERIPFVLYDAGSDDLTDAESHRIIRESFQVWEDVPSARVAFSDLGVTSTRTPSRRDRRNLIFFDETNAFLQAPRGSGIIAVTRLNSNALTGKITDADIIFNGLEFRFSSNEEPVRGTVNLKDVAVHEVGHLLGLEHTPLDGPASSRPTMNPFNRGDGPGLGQTLEADDIAGVSFLYPTPDYALSVGSISGTVSNLRGDGLFGVHVVAQNTETQTQISTVSGAYDGQGGRYRIEGLPPGPYRVQMTPIEGSINADNFGGIFSEFATDFTPEFYDNSRVENTAQTIEVKAGQTVRKIDFTTGFIRPGFPSVELSGLAANTPDTTGPYTVRVQAINTDQLWLHYRSSLALSDRIPMRSAGENLFAANIPGQPVSAQVEYRIEARNDSIDQIFYPENERWFSFDILELSGAPLAFTALRGSDFISVVDTDTRAEQARIAVGDEPIQIIAGPAGYFLYVSNLSSNEISVISAATFQEVERIETAVQPLDMAISPNGSTLYATNSGAGTLTIVDLETRSARTAWLAGLSTGPYGIAARNDKVFATDLTNDQLLIMDSEGIIQSRIDVAPQPRSMALSPDGKLLYITSMGENVLTVIDAETDQIDSRARLPVSGTFAVAVHPTGEKVYLTAHDEGSVLILKADDLSIQAQIATGDNPRSIAFTPDGQTAFVTNAFSDETVLIDATTDRLVGRYRSGDEPRGIVVNNPVQLSQDTSVYEMGATPSRYSLDPPYPNPFNAETQITYRLPSDSQNLQPVRLEIYNGLGQRVRMLVDAVQEPGNYRVQWDGLDERGEMMSTGVYILSLQAGSYRQARKLLLLR